MAVALVAAAITEVLSQIVKETVDAAVETVKMEAAAELAAAVQLVKDESANELKAALEAEMKSAALVANLVTASKSFWRGSSSSQP